MDFGIVNIGGIIILGGKHIRKAVNFLLIIQEVGTGNINLEVKVDIYVKNVRVVNLWNGIIRIISEAEVRS